MTIPRTRTYFVAMDGDDANDGRSEETPMRTVSAALAAANGEPCTVMLGPGHYETDTFSGVRYVGAGTSETLLRERASGMAALMDEFRKFQP